jgi:sphingolipid delta-4 desaturase
MKNINKESFVFDPSNKCKLTTKLDDFIWTESDEPHAERRTQIMKAHPEVKDLFGHTWETKYIVILLLTVQISTAYALRSPDMTWSWQFWVIAYVVGGTTT